MRYDKRKNMYIKPLKTKVYLSLKFDLAIAEFLFSNYPEIFKKIYDSPEDRLNDFIKSFGKGMIVKEYGLSSDEDE